MHMLLSPRLLRNVRKSLDFLLTLRLQLLTGLRPDCHASSFRPIGLHSAELLGSALRFLLTLRP